ncbi:ABC transporter permease [Cohnella nanjingensis]|uniref:ABC transporter permease n=1 Tax=Cohnella nanjingensis TaxID=1387779 RepID=A0A7X0VG90_9BACL|nr:ABC transporter permease [Cohnella nanjingensis]MBB6671409.1 ABC transporter permease [Cohnella nanjingensis]
MALFVMILRKMVQNRWLVVSLFLGMLISVALVSSMPIYSEAILSRMLVKELETMQTERNVYPGSYWSKIAFDNQTTEQRQAVLKGLDDYMRGPGASGFRLPVKELVQERNTRTFTIFPENATDDVKKNTKRTARFASLSGLQDHIKLTDGRMPAVQPVDGVYEVLVTESGLNNFRTVLDKVLDVEDAKIQGKIKVKPVGVFEKRVDDDPYFRDPSLGSFNSSLVVDAGLFDRQFTAAGIVPVSNAGWFIVLDYAKMELRLVEDFTKTSNEIQAAVKKRVSAYQVDFTVPALKTIDQYMERAKQLRTLMWSLNVPVLIMLGFYMFMVANLIASRQKNEIAVLRSRGAARWQIVVSFAVEGLLLSGLALAAGPPLGMLLTEVLGASNGFLSFVQRAALPVRLTQESYLYGAAAAAVAFVMLLIPVLLATRTTIVGHKQQMARLTKTPLWHKLFLDVVALALAIYGLYAFDARMKDLKKLGLRADDLKIDPLQFVVPALFIVGAGLLLLRLYPYLLRLIYAIGRKWWSPSMYATLIQVGRSNSQYQFLMVFLILTIATGVFSASAARTINNNTEDRIRYGNGADFVMKAEWPNDKPIESPGGMGGPPTTSATVAPQAIHYLEPSFEPYEKLPGVAQAAKVFMKDKASFTVGDQSGGATLIGIDTDDFGRAAWFRTGLLAHPLSDYLNLIAGDPKAVLISKTLATQKKVKTGDTIWVGWDGVTSQPFTVYGIIEYFPTFNPNPPIGSVNAGDAETQSNAPMLIVGHLPRIQFQLALEPYDVWIKMKPGYDLNAFYKGIEESHISLVSIRNTTTDWNKAKNDPFLLALNGILTLGFILSIVVSFVGFLLYWILSLRGRTLQNGIMRAVGLSVRHMIGMLVIEQLLTSGVAVLIGIIVGNMASRLYVPNFQIAFNPSTLVPPFRVLFEGMDFVRLYATVGVMLLAGLCILGYMVSRIRIHQALKLGED